MGRPGVVRKNKAVEVGRRGGYVVGFSGGTVCANDSFFFILSIGPERRPPHLIRYLSKLTPNLVLPWGRLASLSMLFLQRKLSTEATYLSLRSV